MEILESNSFSEIAIKLKNGQMGFFVTDEINGPGIVYKTKSGRVFGSSVFSEIDTKTMLAFEKTLG